MHDILNLISSFIWGPFTLILILGTGIFLSLGLKGFTLTFIVVAFRQIFSKEEKSSDGEISSFQSLTTALSATVGTGNIAGVATAIFVGGPGAIFWMWVSAIFGMATKFAEAFLAIKFREKNSHGETVGGPMYYIKNGLSQRYRIFAYLFAAAGMIAALGIGNGVQVNSVSQVIHNEFGISELSVGIFISILVALVILGGIKSIGKITSTLVPFMSIVYIFGGLLIIIFNSNEVGYVFNLIITSAFNGTAAAGGFAGATVWMALRYGVARGVFSNEAGLGSSPIAHAAANTNNPVKQGMISMLEPLIDTLIVCTITAFVILLSNQWIGELNGAVLTASSFEYLFENGKYIVIFGLILFSFSTIIGWSYYGEKCAEFLFGSKIVTPYRILWVLIIPLAATIELNLMWLIADIMNGLMSIPNLLALILLAPVVFTKTQELKNQFKA
ncbi:MAG: sodium:alanine symporter family protein [Gammaproteobacteria bacterium]